MKIDPGTGLAGGRRVNGRPVSCQAMCEKKPAGQKSLSQIPWQELGMRSLSLLHHLPQLSPGWGAGAMWLLAREGELGERCWCTCALPPAHAQGNQVQMGTGRLAPSSTHTGLRYAIKTMGRSRSLPAWCRLEGINRGYLFQTASPMHIKSCICFLQNELNTSRFNDNYNNNNNNPSLCRTLQSFPETPFVSG